MDNIVITGATSMIGIALVKAAISDSVINHIYAVVRPGTSKKRRLPVSDKITVIECGIDEYSRLLELVPSNVDIFFHLAWPRTSTYTESFEDTYEKANNLLYVLDALKIAHRLNCRAFIGAGSQSEYGIVKSGSISPETICNPVRTDGVIHLAAGRLVERTASGMGMDSAWMRIFSVYGIYDRDNSLIKSTIHKLKNGEKCTFTDSLQMWDYLYEDDAGRAFLEVGKKIKGNKTYNVGYGQANPLRTYISTVRDMVSPGTELFFGELPYPENPVMNLQCDISSLVNDTGWHPLVSFEKGIGKIIENEAGSSTM